MELTHPAFALEATTTIIIIIIIIDTVKTNVIIHKKLKILIDMFFGTFYIGWRGRGRDVRPLSFELSVSYFFFRIASLISPDYNFINLHTFTLQIRAY